MADFQNRLISRIFGVFSSGFLHRTTLIFLYNRFAHVFGHFNFLAKLTILQTIALASLPIFKMGSFFEYLVFFQPVFCTVEL